MGTVAGNGLAPYQTLVTHKGEAQHGEPLWISRCTCPVGAECKHAVATLISARTALENGDVPVPAPGSESAGESNVVPLFGQPGARGAGGVTATWRQKLDASLNPRPPERPTRSSAGPSSDAWRAQIGLQFQERTVPSSLTDSSPVQRVEVKPTKLMRTGRWSRTATWVDVRSKAGIPDAEESQQAAVRRVLQGHAPKVGSGQTVFLDEFGPALWPALREAQEAGVTLMLASTPGEGVTLAEPAEVALGIHQRDGALVLTADVVGADLQPEQGWAELIGEPAHGVAILDRGSLRLVPFHEVPHALVQKLLLGDVIEVPADEVAEFEAEYLPQLRRQVAVSDVSATLEEPVEPRLLLEIEPVAVAKVVLRTFFLYDERRVPTTPGGGAGRLVSSESAVIARAGALLGRLRLTRSVPHHELWVKQSAELTGMEAVRLADAIPELAGHRGRRGRREGRSASLRGG